MFFIFVSAIENSDDRSFVSVLFERHKQKIYKAAYKILGNVQDAEDATSETIIKIIENLQDYRDKNEDELARIFVTIAKNTAIDKCRRRKKIEFAPIPDDYADESNLEEDICDFIVSQDLHKKLYNAIDMLDKKYSSVIKLKLGNNCSDKEIAKILDISVETVKTRYHHAKIILKEALKEGI